MPDDYVGGIRVGYLGPSGSISTAAPDNGSLEVGIRSPSGTITGTGWDPDPPSIGYDPQYLPPVEHPLVFKVSYDGGATTHDLYDYLPGYDANGNAVLYTTTGGFQPQAVTIVIEGLPEGVTGMSFSFLSVSHNSGFCSNASDGSIEGEHQNDDFSFRADRDYVNLEWRELVGGPDDYIMTRVWTGAFDVPAGAYVLDAENHRALCTVYCKDFGAWADMRFYYWVDGVNHQRDFRIPVDEIGGNSPDGIADYYQARAAAAWNLMFAPLEPVTAAAAHFYALADAEPPDPDGDGPLASHEQGVFGDGLTVFQEYRGFKADWSHTEAAVIALSPGQKELLVELDAMGGTHWQSMCTTGLGLLANEFKHHYGVYVYFAEDDLAIEPSVDWGTDTKPRTTFIKEHRDDGVDADGKPVANENYYRQFVYLALCGGADVEWTDGRIDPLLGEMPEGWPGGFVYSARIDEYMATNTGSVALNKVKWEHVWVSTAFHELSHAIGVPEINFSDQQHKSGGTAMGCPMAYFPTDPDPTIWWNQTPPYLNPCKGVNDHAKYIDFDHVVWKTQTLITYKY